MAAASASAGASGVMFPFNLEVAGRVMRVAGTFSCNVIQRRFRGAASRGEDSIQRASKVSLGIRLGE